MIGVMGASGQWGVAYATIDDARRGRRRRFDSRRLHPFSLFLAATWIRHPSPLTCQLGPRLHRERNASTIRAAKTRSVDCLTARPRFLFLHARGGIVTHGAARKAACERRDRDPPCLCCEPRARRVPTRRRTK
jgi:hypothetical protein